jgi:hypothetical protein
MGLQQGKDTAMRVWVLHQWVFYNYLSLPVRQVRQWSHNYTTMAIRLSRDYLSLPVRQWSHDYTTMTIRLSRDKSKSIQYYELF